MRSAALFSWPVTLAIALLILALACALWQFLQHRRQRPDALRLRKAHELIQALDAYCDWIEGQRHLAFFTDETALADSPIVRARSIKHEHFPELSQAMVELLMVHTALTNFFWSQQVRRLKEPAAWVQEEHDAAYLALKTRMLAAVRRMAEQCRDLVGDLPLPQAVRDNPSAVAQYST